MGSCLSQNSSNGVFVPGLTTPMGLDIVGLNMFEQMLLGWGLSWIIPDNYLKSRENWGAIAAIGCYRHA